MAQVDFYVLSQGGEQARRLFACRLAEKAYRLQHKVRIEAATADDARLLDELLWTFRDGSFVPHGRLGEAGDDAPVVIACGEAASAADILINLASDIPEAATAFPRIAELVSSDESSRQEGRRRFAAYRDAGHELHTHNI